tara:strand:+ start:42895 stop:43296 length:402 start_codon:yes stop_codon:yes gene_type:complete
MNKFIQDIDEIILSRLIEGNEDFLNEYLEDNGYDINAIDNISTKKFKQLSFTLNAKLRLEKDQFLLNKVSDMFIDAIEKNLDKPISYLNGLIQRNKLALRYRNLDKLNEEEIRNIIRDQNLLEILEMLEKENE